MTQAASEPTNPAPPAEFEIARVYDFADPITGPGFDPDHRVIEDPDERDRLLDYLEAGSMVLTTTARQDDMLDPAAGAAVPASFRTDGTWIWTDAVTYYLSTHGIAPDARLLAHIHAQCELGEEVPDTDHETAIRAADFLLHPPAEQARTAVWFPADHPAGQPEEHLAGQPEEHPAGQPEDDG